MYNALKEFLSEDRGTILDVDANVCKGMLLRTGMGKVKHLSTKQPWVQGAIQSCGVEGHKCLAP